RTYHSVLENKLIRTGANRVDRKPRPEGSLWRFRVVEAGKVAQLFLDPRADKVLRIDDDHGQAGMLDDPPNVLLDLFVAVAPEVGDKARETDIAQRAGGVVEGR